MLLFFIAQMTAWADSCKAENLNTQEMNYTIYMCDYGFEKEVEAASNWWNSKGGSLTVAEGFFDCDNITPTDRQIFIDFNNKEVEKRSTNNATAYAVTIRRHADSSQKTVLSSRIYLSTSLKNYTNKRQVFIVHEIGHAIGFNHVSDSCQDYIMNPYISGMGNKL